jgi:hypothetical protein
MKKTQIKINKGVFVCVWKKTENFFLSGGHHGYHVVCVSPCVCVSVCFVYVMCVLLQGIIIIDDINLLERFFVVVVVLKKT